MRTHVESIEIAAPPEQAHAFLADPEKLYVWAIGFAKAIEHDGDGWVVTTASGDRVGIRIVSDSEHGIVDYVMTPAPGVEVAAHTRVVAANGARSVPSRCSRLPAWRTPCSTSRSPSSSVS